MRHYSWSSCARLLATMATLVFSLALFPDRAAAQGGDWRWGGLLFDSFALDREAGIEAWTVEDGGRIRHRNPTTGLWTFQVVPSEVKDTLRRVHFLPDGQTGWACGMGGWVLKTTNGGSTWSTLGARIPAQVAGPDPYEDLYDIHFVNANDGWMVGVHSLWWTEDGGVHWYAASIYDPNTQSFLTLEDPHRLWAIDVIEWPDGSRLGLAVMQPGFVLRCYASNANDPLLVWQKVWDVEDLCPCGPGSPLTGCECDICNAGHVGPWLELWDVEISRDPATPLALFCGGVGPQCGMIFASTPTSTSQIGLTWTKEWHECTCSGGPPCKDCTVLPEYNDDPNDPFDLNRHQNFKTLYGLAIQRTSDSAVAAGYNGQLVVRDAATGVWQDRSRFAGGVASVPGAIVFPLIGAETGTGTWDPDFALVTGEGGHLLESTDGGNTWSNAWAPLPAGELIGEPHRIQDVHFSDDQVGWRVGQFFRIARSDDRGFHWTEQLPQASASLGNCRAVTFEPLGLHGVAVGDPYNPGSGTTLPKIRWTDSGGAPPNNWSDSVTILGDPNYINGKALREVDWAGGSNFWTVGGGGLILSSTNNGLTWRTFRPSNDPALEEFTLEGVAFRDTTNGIFVGTRPVNGGSAYQYLNSGGASWAAMALPGGVTIERLLDVDIEIGGQVAWAVGEKMVSGTLQGIVIMSTLSGGSFGPFTEVVNPAGFTPSTAGDALDCPILNEVAIAPGTGDLWVGGMCGRMWVRDAGSGAWTEIKSQTDAHVVGLSFVPVGTGDAAGYVAGFRSNKSQQCIVRVQ